MKIKYHDDFPKLDHRAAPSIPGRARWNAHFGDWNEQFAARPQGAPWGRATRSTGEFSNGAYGENYSGINT